MSGWLCLTHDENEEVVLILPNGEEIVIRGLHDGKQFRYAFSAPRSVNIKRRPAGFVWKKKERKSCPSS